jgi:hypothetical protein
MNRAPVKPSRAPLPALLIAACLAALEGASCGRAESPLLDSETHWLEACDSDQDCGAGRCECGVCTSPCVTNADCAGLGVAGVECVPPSGTCASLASATGESFEGAACLLSCVDDADCGGLGAGARCESERCERPTLSSLNDTGGASTGAALCDGSEDIRFVWLEGGGFVSSYYYFTESRGVSFVAIDGQCRFWRSTAPGGVVYTGVLEPEDATSFASAVDYERVLEIGTFEDPPDCNDGGTNVIWTPESRITCSCGPCSSDPSAPPGWTVAFGAMSDARLDAWLRNAQPMTGPARMALVGFEDFINDPNPLLWPLSRSPRPSEMHSAPGSLDESSGAEVTDANELSLLRETRATYLAREPGSDHTLLEQITPSSTRSRFRMLLRDELPAPAQAALRAASGVP